MHFENSVLGSRAQRVQAISTAKFHYQFQALLIRDTSDPFPSVRNTVLKECRICVFLAFSLKCKPPYPMPSIPTHGNPHPPTVPKRTAAFHHISSLLMIRNRAWPNARISDVHVEDKASPPIPEAGIIVRR